MRGLAVILLIAASGPSTALAANPPADITFELVTKPGLSVTASQQWYKILTSLGVSGLRIRQAISGDEAGIEQQGTKFAPRYRVVGILAADNVLYLPGGKFKTSDTDRLRKWLARVGDEGAEGVTDERAAFGLTPRQLSEIQADLKRPVRFATPGAAADKVAARIGKDLKLPLVVDAPARRELSAVKVSDELQGLSSGTALAVVLRPVGLALLPERPAGGELQLHVVDRPSRPGVLADRLEDQDRRRQAARRIVRISQCRDQGNLGGRSRRGDSRPSEGAVSVRPWRPWRCTASIRRPVQAKVPEKRMTYSQILGKVLMQARLKYELRVDDADKPFLWITTVKPAA